MSLLLKLDSELKGICMAKELTAEEKIELFKDELGLIFDKSVREFARLAIVTLPSYFFNDCASSSSGKYHPVSDLTSDGNLKHTKKVFTVVYDLCRAMGIEESRDLLLLSALLHDGLKQGKIKTGHTVKNHPDLAAKHVAMIQQDTGILTDEQYTVVHNCCGYHYGLWGSGEWKKPLSEYTPEELCLYLSDYIASKRFIEVNYKR